MSQILFIDPVVSSGPSLVGVGNGTVSIDRLTHFTIGQTYTLTCIAKTPDTLFAVTGSLDGPVGIALVGTQFYDEDLKVFFTIQQGSTVFEIGDVFTFAVINGTDLNQDNIDDYDELPQKNFGLGTKGLAQGDHNLRYLSTNENAYLYRQDLRYQAVAAGVAGNSVQIEYLAPVPAVAAVLVLQDLTFTATPGAAGNLVSVEYIDYTPAATASITEQNLTYVADAIGAGGNLISIEYIGGGTAGSELVSVLSNAITVEIDDGVSTANQIKTAIEAFPAAAALVDLTIFGVGSTAQVIQGPTFLLGGLDAFGEAGDEEVSITGTDIQVTLETGVSTAAQVKSAIEAHGSFGGLGVTITVSGVASDPQTAPEAQQFLAGGADSYGYVGDETVQVVGNLIKIFFESGKSTATQVKTAFDAFPAAVALASLAIIGFASEPQLGVMAATNLANGANKYYSFNKAEFTDSGNFVEGNAGVRIRDAKLRGQLDVDGHADFKSAVRVDDQTPGSNSGPALPSVQRTINELIQDQKISIYSDNDDAKIAWSQPTLTFADDIFIRFNDTAVLNTIQSSESPITLLSGESAYVVLSRYSAADLEIVVSGTIPRHVDCLRLATRLGNNIRLWDNTLIRDNSSATIGEGGSGNGGIIKADLFDPVSTVLPTGVSATIDAVSVANGDLVLFSALTVGANRVYEVSGVGVAVVFTAVSIFETGLDPVGGDLVILSEGTGFANQIAEYDGTSFKVNPYTRYFNGADYWELSSLQTSAIVNNTTAVVFTVAYAGSENMIVDFSISRGVAKDTGTLHITTDGTTVAVTTTGAYIGASGVTFSAAIVGPNLVLSYTSDNNGSSGGVKYFVRRWSNNAGGPAGLPSYGGGGGSVTAAGSSGDIQFNAAGVLGADGQFTWDSTNNIMTKAGLQSSGMNGPIVLADNQVSAAAAFSYDKTSYPFVVIEYSIQRDADRDTGRLLISTNGTDIGFSEDSVSTNPGGNGVTLTAVVSGANIEIRYTTTSTGFNGSLKYAFRRWS